MINLESEFGKRVARRLQEDSIIWLVTVRDDRTPQPTPVWFLWEGDGFLIYSRPQAQKLRNIARNPKVTLHFDGDGLGGDIIVFRGEAQIDATVLPADQVPAYLQKNQAGLDRIGTAPEDFAGTYSVPIRVKVTRLYGH